MPKDFLSSFVRSTLSGEGRFYLNRLMRPAHGQKKILQENLKIDRSIEPLAKSVGLTNMYQLRLVFLSRGKESFYQGFNACKTGDDVLAGLTAAKKFSLNHLQYDRLSFETKQKLNEICPRLAFEKDPAVKNKLMREAFVLCAGMEKNFLHMLKKGMVFTPEFVALIFNGGALKLKIHRLFRHPELKEVAPEIKKEKDIFELSLQQLEQLEQKFENKLSRLQFLTPAGNKSSKQGLGPDPFNKKKQRDHSGIDYGNPQGSPVDSVYSGKVVAIDTHSAYGKYVVIESDTDKGKIYTMYGHLSGVDIELGQRVKLGQPIARVGSTGHSTDPHLHLEKRAENSFAQGRGEYLKFTELIADSSSKKI